VISGTHPVGGTTNGQLNGSDCRLSDGTFIDYLRTTVATAGTYLFNLASTDFDAVLILYLAGGHVVGFNDDFTGTNSMIKVLAPARDFDIGVNEYDPNIVGNYSLTSSTTTEPVTNCDEVFVVKGISSAQSLQTTDCLFGTYDDDYLIFIEAGETVTFSMNSGTVDSRLELYDLSGAPLATNEDRDATTKDAQLTYTAPAAGFYIIAATTLVSGATGDYTLVVQ
jgi:hypothetical protein